MTHPVPADQLLTEIRNRAARGPNPDAPMSLAARDRLVLLELVDQLAREKEDDVRSMRDRAAQVAYMHKPPGMGGQVMDAILALPLIPGTEPPAATFHLRTEHVTLLRHQGDRDPHAKRPYGNSDIPVDVARLLNWHTDVDENPAAWDEALSLHEQTGNALAVILSAGTTEPGVYHQDQSGTWHLAGAR